MSALLDLLIGFGNNVNSFFNFISGGFSMIGRAATGIFDFFQATINLFGVLSVGVPSIFLTFAGFLLAIAAVRIVIELL